MTMALPECLEGLLDLAENRCRGEQPMVNQVTFPIHCDDQLKRLRRTLWRRGINPDGWRFNRHGLEVGFPTEEDAVLAKMSFDAS